MAVGAEALHDQNREPSPERHRQFVPLIAAVERAERAGEEGRVLRASDTLKIHDAFAHGLLPHAVGEGRTLFPVLRQITGSDAETTEMTREHREIARLTDELERIASDRPSASREQALRSILRNLRSTVQSHFQEEEAVCFRILSTELPPEEARAICEAMERTATDLREIYE
jgi:iron-sulfur cluster repair protein YtfE (RIC family)